MDLDLHEGIVADEGVKDITHVSEKSETTASKLAPTMGGSSSFWHHRSDGGHWARTFGRPG